MSSRSRGNKFELEVKKMYEERGYLVERALAKLVWIPGRKVPISQSHDFFGLWDLVAVREGGLPIWIQVSTTNEVATKRKQLTTSYFPTGAGMCLLYARDVGASRRQFRVYNRSTGYMTYTIDKVED